MKSEGNDEDTIAKDPFIKRKVPACMVGQAISVVGGYEKEKTPPPEAPAAVNPENLTAVQNMELLQCYIVLLKTHKPL